MPITTNVVNSDLEVYLIQHHVIMFVSDLRKVGISFSGYSTNKTDRHDITEILFKVALNTINLLKKKSPKKHVDI